MDTNSGVEIRTEEDFKLVQSYQDYFEHKYGVKPEDTETAIKLYGCKKAEQAAILNSNLKDKNFLRIAKLVSQNPDSAEYAMTDEKLFARSANMVGAKLTFGLMEKGHSLESFLTLLTDDPTSQEPDSYYAIRTFDEHNDEIAYLISPEFTGDTKRRVFSGMRYDSIDTVLSEMAEKNFGHRIRKNEIVEGMYIVDVMDSEETPEFNEMASDFSSGYDLRQDINDPYRARPEDSSHYHEHMVTKSLDAALN